MKQQKLFSLLRAVQAKSDSFQGRGGNKQLLEKWEDFSPSFEARRDFCAAWQASPELELICDHTQRD
jgi:hypothetical protein